jgi:hypothetical protein
MNTRYIDRARDKRNRKNARRVRNAIRTEHGMRVAKQILRNLASYTTPYGYRLIQT